MIETFESSTWADLFTDSNQVRAITRLEEGNLLYFPDLPFVMAEDEKVFLTPDFADPNSKNISYNAANSGACVVYRMKNVTA